MPTVFDTQNPNKYAWEVSEQWVEIMNTKEPGRYQVKTAPKIINIPKKKVVVVVGKKYEPVQLTIKKETVSLNTVQTSASTKRTQPKSKGSK